MWIRIISHLLYTVLCDMSWSDCSLLKTLAVNWHGRRESPMGILSLLPGDCFHCPRVNWALAWHGVASPIGLKIKAHQLSNEQCVGNILPAGSKRMHNSHNHIYYKILYSFVIATKFYSYAFRTHVIECTEQLFFPSVSFKSAWKRTPNKQTLNRLFQINIVDFLPVRNPRW